MSFEEAAAVPLAALTAYQSLFDAAGLRSGETVLIHAASGGVGSFAVQLAKDKGATVLGTAGADSHEHLRSLGVDVPVDYSAQDFRDAVRQACPEGVHVVLDSVGGDTLTRSEDILHRNGRLVSIVDPHGIGELKKNGRRAAFVFVEPNREQLAVLTSMIESGGLKTCIAAAFPLEDAAKAHELSESHHTHGKIVLTV
jgi:NADPH:quinone reductase-like Zn-dependent oxidoreductase